MKYGILSAARIVPRFVKGIQESEDGNAYAIASRSAKRAEKAAKEMNIPKYFGSYEELLADPDIDMVYIPTVNHTHCMYAKQALEYRKHVILEKPFTLRFAEAEELFALAERNGCFLMEDQKELFLPVTQEVKRMITEGKIGDIQYIEMIMSHPNSHPKGNWMYDLKAGGGALFGSGSYPIEYAFHLLDSTDFRSEACFVKGEETSDNLVHFFLSDGKVIVSVTISMDVVLPNKAVIYGKTGRIEVENFWKADHFTAVINGETNTYRIPYSSEFTYVVNHVSRCISSGMLTSDVATPEITKKCVRVTEHMYKSYEI